MSTITVARSSITPESGAGVFHCVSRCVRRAWLCGVDPYNNKDYSHRKQWVRDRLEQLAGSYAVEVYAYAVMSNGCAPLRLCKVHFFPKK